MLIDKIKQDRIQAMKDKDTLKKDLLGVLIGDATKDNKQPEDSKVIAMVKKFIANAKECELNAPGMFAAKYLTEIEILEAYLPSQLSTEALEKTVLYAIQLGHNNQGALNKYLKAEFDGRYDGKTANEIIKRVLNG